ncbi:hypothetical protein ACFLRX_04885 [Acidobacteriota bacterium]
MIRLNVTPERVRELFQTVVISDGSPAAKFEKSKHVYWKMNNNGTITHGPSILWLFCWAYNGMGSPSAESSARDVFNAIFPFRYEEFLANVGYQYSNKNRYKTSDNSGRIVMEEIVRKIGLRETEDDSFN